VWLFIDRAISIINRSSFNVTVDESDTERTDSQTESPEALARDGSLAAENVSRRLLLA